MGMKTTLLKSYAFNLSYAKKLVEGVDEKMMTTSGGPGLENHAAFTLGHLVSAASLTVKYLGGTYQMPENWDELFRRKGPGDPRKPIESDFYPSKEVLLSELAFLHGQVEQLLLEFPEDELAQPAKWRLSEYMSTKGDLIYFMCISHESMHLGQLAGWRRAMGLPSALAKL